MIKYHHKIKIYETFEYQAWPNRISSEQTFEFIEFWYSIWQHKFIHLHKKFCNELKHTIHVGLASSLVVTRWTRNFIELELALKIYIYLLTIIECNFRSECKKEKKEFNITSKTRFISIYLAIIKFAFNFFIEYMKSSIFEIVLMCTLHSIYKYSGRFFLKCLLIFMYEKYKKSTTHILMTVAEK